MCVVASADPFTQLQRRGLFHQDSKTPTHIKFKTCRNIYTCFFEYNIEATSDREPKTNHCHRLLPGFDSHCPSITTYTLFPSCPNTNRRILIQA